MQICIKMTFTDEGKIFCVTTLYLESKSYKTVQAKFRWRFSFNLFPAKSAIHQWFSKIKATGTVLSINKKAAALTSGMKMTAKTPGNIEAVRTSVGRSPKKSIRRRLQELGTSHTSVQRILNIDLHLYPYRIQIKLKLTHGDKIKRVVMCQCFQDKIELSPNFPNDIWFSNKAHFLFSGQVNSKNNILQGTGTGAMA